jgi:hypothetical protein
VESTAGWHCYSEWAYKCTNGVPYGEHCPTSAGSTCFVAADGGGYCPTAGTPCSPPDTYSCSGSSVVACYESGNQASYDCSVNAATCSESDSGTIYCLSPGCTVQDSESCTESCGTDGVTLQLCVGGAPFQVNCAEHGYGNCATYHHSSLDMDLAYCY